MWEAVCSGSLVWRLSGKPVRSDFWVWRSLGVWEGVPGFGGGLGGGANESIGENFVADGGASTLKFRARVDCAEK